jgi:AcrR family transcriptional regulator
MEMNAPRRFERGDQAMSTEEETDTPPPNKRQAAKIQTRQKVLDAARTLFVERGYDPAVIRDIAKGAGMSTGAVFANFRDKAELLHAILEGEFSVRHEQMVAAAAESGTIRARIVAISAVDYRLFIKRAPLAGMLTALAWQKKEQHAIATRIITAEQKVVSMIARLIEEGIKSHEIQGVDPQLAAEMLWSTHVGNYELAVFGGWDEKELNQRFSEQLAQLISHTSPQ